MNDEYPHADADDCGVNAAAYVLGALTDDEHRAFVVHLETCAICQEEVAALKVVAASLPAAAPQLSAPEDLKRRVMATVHQEASLHGAAAPATAAPARSVSARQRFAWLGWRPALAAGGLAAAIVAVLVVALSSGGGGASARTIHAEVLAPKASATVRLSGGHAELDVADMPQPTPNRVYEVWIKRSGAPQPTDALFTVSNTGAATVGVPGSLNGVKEILVTSEPRGGSRVPTRAPVIIADVS
jgi:anti-sigma-K factor RskA